MRSLIFAQAIHRAMLAFAILATPLQQTFAADVKASAVLPGTLLASPNYKIREEVKSDGMVNTYDLDTKYGPVRVQGTPLLLVRTNELNALARIEKLEETSVYQQALEKGAKSPLKGAEALIDDPVNTVKGAATGIGNWFSDVGRSVTSKDPHQAGVAETALGQAAAKRAFAFEFGVDPYSGFKPLQAKLNDIGWAAAGGGLTTRVAFSLIPGAVGTVISATGTTEGMRALVRDKSPAQLEKINQATLSAMAVDGKTAAVLLKNQAYTPQERTFLIGEMDSLKGIKGRARFIAAASGAGDESKAIYMRYRAQMIARYVRETKTDGSLIEADQTLFLKTAKGQVIGHFPMDNLPASAAFSAKLTAVNASIGKLKGVTGKQLYLGGSIDSGVRKEMESTGWKVHDKQFELPGTVH